MRGIIRTGQVTCHDAAGKEIACQGTGQDGEFRSGIPWPKPRFEATAETVRDRLTGLMWTRNANLAEFPLTWRESLDFINDLNLRQAFGYRLWRLPNRRELRSVLSYQTCRPALPEGHPFVNVFPGWYWTSTTAAINTAYAWYVHLEGARMFYGGKEQYYLLWPVSGEGNGLLPATGQNKCYDAQGDPIPCSGSGQDGAFRFGRVWPVPRFETAGNNVNDKLTGLCWFRTADLAAGVTSWPGAFEAIQALNRKLKTACWRLPNINELESLVDCSAHSPALPHGHPFRDVQDAYWSSTTSLFEPDWAWALYMRKGAVGVGQKNGAHFAVWAVSDLQ